eukprot:scaffold81438_cov32-Tisochrysis_lutea.AAC.1
MASCPSTLKIGGIKDPYDILMTFLWCLALRGMGMGGGQSNGQWAGERGPGRAICVQFYGRVWAVEVLR